jgi:signal transduction histidine kinase
LIERRGIGINLSCDENVSVYCSPEMMITAVASVLLNSVDSFDRFNKKNKEVIVTAHRNKTDLEITVADNGPGIPTDHLSEVFNPCFTTKTRSLGLGKTIALRIVEAHGGNIQVESRYGEETRVVLTIPVFGKDSKTDVEEEV